MSWVRSSLSSVFNALAVFEATVMSNAPAVSLAYPFPNAPVASEASLLGPAASLSPTYNR